MSLEHIPAMHTVMPATGCCPRFDPTPWEGTLLVWDEKPFLKDHVTCLFHVPLNMGRRITKDLAMIEAAHARTAQPLMLSDEKSPWGADIYIDVKSAVPGATMSKLSGTFLTKVFEGPFRDAGKWAQEMRSFVTSKGQALERLYFGYTTCPACARAYGKNYVILFAKLRESDEIAATD